MMIAFRALEQRDWPYVVENIDLAWAENTSGVVAFNAEDGTVCAAMVCQSWTENSVQCHFMVTHKAALRHKFHNECARYVFSIGGREKMIGIIPSDNEKALKLDKRFGFTDVGVIKDAYSRGVDAVIMELHRDNCPYWDDRQMEAA